MTGRTGSAKWMGDVRTGAGEVTVGEHAWTGDYSGSSRFGGVLPGFADGAGTNPEELLAAAHAACFTMALSLALTEGGSPPPRLLQTRARVHLRFIDGAPRIQRIDLEAEGDVPGLDEPVFRDRAEEAKRSCIISRALSGVEQINVVARLAAPQRGDSLSAAGTEGGGDA
jgi:lipoyl-dependent peroxiredoxin